MRIQFKQVVSCIIYFRARLAKRSHYSTARMSIPPGGISLNNCLFMLWKQLIVKLNASLAFMKFMQSLLEH